MGHLIAAVDVRVQPPSAPLYEFTAIQHSAVTAAAWPYNVRQFSGVTD